MSDKNFCQLAVTSAIGQLASWTFCKNWRRSMYSYFTTIGNVVSLISWNIQTPHASCPLQRS